MVLELLCSNTLGQLLLLSEKGKVWDSLAEQAYRQAQADVVVLKVAMVNQEGGRLQKGSYQ